MTEYGLVFVVAFFAGVVWLRRWNTQHKQKLLERQSWFALADSWSLTYKEQPNSGYLLYGERNGHELTLHTSPPMFERCTYLRIGDAPAHWETLFSIAATKLWSAPFVAESLAGPHLSAADLGMQMPWEKSHTPTQLLTAKQEARLATSAQLPEPFPEGRPLTPISGLFREVELGPLLTHAGIGFTSDSLYVELSGWREREEVGALLDETFALLKRLEEQTAKIRQKLLKTLLKQSKSDTREASIKALATAFPESQETQEALDALHQEAQEALSHKPTKNTYKLWIWRWAFGEASPETFVPLKEHTAPPLRLLGHFLEDVDPHWDSETCDHSGGWSDWATDEESIQPHLLSAARSMLKLSPSCARLPLFGWICRCITTWPQHPPPALAKELLYLLERLLQDQSELFLEQTQALEDTLFRWFVAYPKAARQNKKHNIALAYKPKEASQLEQLRHKHPLEKALTDEELERLLTVTLLLMGKVGGAYTLRQLSYFIDEITLSTELTEQLTDVTDAIRQRIQREQHSLGQLSMPSDTDETGGLSLDQKHGQLSIDEEH